MLHLTSHLQFTIVMRFIVISQSILRSEFTIVIIYCPNVTSQCPLLIIILHFNIKVSDYDVTTLYFDNTPL